MYLVLTLPGLVSAQTEPPAPTSRPSTGSPPSPASQPSLGLQFVPGKDVPHWSGLPIWGKEEAEKLGYDLPLPIGISATYFGEKENFHMPELKLGGPGGRLFDAGSLVRVSNIRIAESAEMARLEAWVLPFFNVYALAGYVNGSADIGIQPAMLPTRWAPTYNLHLDYDGGTIGLGGTLAAGFKPFKDRSTILFGLVDLNVTETFLTFRQVVTSLEPVTVAVLNIRGGVRERIMHLASLGDVYASVWGGVMWEGVQEVMSGSVSILNLDFQGNIRAINPWNTVIGAGLEVGKHINMMIDVGVGERQSLMFSATIRF